VVTTVTPGFSGSRHLLCANGCAHGVGSRTEGCGPLDPQAGQCSGNKRAEDQLWGSKGAKVPRVG